MHKISATILILAAVIVCTNAFFSSNPYPQYGPRMQNRRRYRQPKQKYHHKPQQYGQYRHNPEEKRGYRQQQQKYFRKPPRHQQYRHHPEQRRGKEIIKDLQRKIELYVPCSPYCRYYEARVKQSDSFSHSRNLKTIQVSGPGYEKSWDIPRNVDVNKITKSIVHSQYFKLEFPKLILSEKDYFERDFQNYDKYHSVNEDEKQNQQTRHQNHRQSKHESYHTDYYTEKKNEYNRFSIYGNRDNYDEKGTKEEEQTQSKAEVDPYFYTTSDGIEIVDVDTNDMENEFYEKDPKKVSIGFWDSRGKFQYY